MSDIVAAAPLWASVVAQVLIVLGALLFSTAAVGLVRLPDVYTRASAVSTAAGAGVALIIIGAWVYIPGFENWFKLLLAVLMQVCTSAVGTAHLARAAYLTGSAIYSPSHHDELGDAAEDTDPADPTDAAEDPDADDADQASSIRTARDPRT